MNENENEKEKEIRKDNPEPTIVNIKIKEIKNNDSVERFG